MNFLTQALPLARKAIRSSGWYTPAVACAIVGLEISGRLTKSDAHDILGIFALMFLTLLILERHRVNPIPWVARAGRFIERFFTATSTFKFEIGIDFRKTPPIPARVPTVLVVVPVILALVTAGGILAWSLFPNGWRQPLSQVFYLGYLATLLVLWGAVLLTIVLGFCLPNMVLAQVLPNPRTSNPWLTRKHVLFIAGYVGVTTLAYFLIPFWVIPALCGATLLAIAAATAVPSASGVQFIWRESHKGPVWSISSRKMVVRLAATVVLGLTAMIALSCGNVVLGLPEAESTMPLTVAMGIALGWLIPGILLSGTVLLARLWQMNPSRPCRPSVHVRDSAMRERGEIYRTFTRWGWDVSFESAPRSIDVKIRIVPAEQSDAREFQPQWPLAVSMADLREGSIRERLERRDEIHKRRLFLRGLETLFRTAKSMHPAGGSGYWLAPHQWLLQGMLRDDMDENEGDESSFLTRPVGLPYGQLLHRSVRHYLYVLMNSLEIDLIFVEDGVGYRRLRRVLRTMFEIYDKSDGKKRAEESQFMGLPRIKVMIHEFLLDRPFESDVYPEPRFENLGRARIMHIFKDRGDDGVEDDVPFDFSFEPEPMYL